LGPDDLLVDDHVVAWFLLTTVDAIPRRLYQPGVALTRAQAVFTVRLRADGVKVLLPIGTP